MSSTEGKHARATLSRAAAILATVAAGREDPLSHLETIREVKWLIEHAEGRLADAAYREGHSFADIARARSTSRQNERKAWTTRAERRDVDPFDRYFQVLDQQIQDRKRRQHNQRFKSA